MPAPPRSAGGRRYYEPAHVERLRFIRRARDLGFGLDNIRALMALSSGGAESCAQARAIAAAHLADVRAKLRDLARLEKTLATTVAQCDARCDGVDVPTCPVIEVLAA